MNSVLTFESQILRIKKRVFIHNCARAFLTCVVLFSSFYAVAIGLDLWIDVSFINSSWFLPLALAGSLGSAMIYIALHKRRFLDILIEMDHRLNLHDSVSTAYEYRKLGKQSALGGLLMDRVARLLFSLKNRELFPIKFSWLYPWLGAMILVHLVIAFKIRNPSSVEPLVVPSKAVQLIDAYLHDQAIRKKKSLQGAGSKSRKKIANNLEKLSRDLKRSSTTRDDLAGSIGKMLKEITSGQSVVAKELGEQLKLHDFEEIPVQSEEAFEKWSLMNLKQLQMMVDRMFDHQVPETISERLLYLQEQQQLKDALDSLLDKMDDPKARGKTESRSDRDQKNGQSGTGSGSRRGVGLGEKALESRAFSDSGKGDAHMNESGQSEAENDGDGGGDPGDGEGSDDGISPTAGKGRADGSLKSKRPIDSAKGGAVQDRSLPSSKDYYRAHIRALTAIGQAKLENREVVRKYQKEVEGVLQKEDIPLNYRMYIRNYFLSIGLRKEK